MIDQAAETAEASFFAWRRTIADRDRQRGRPRARAGAKTPASAAFVPLRVISTPVGTAFEVVLRDGCIVRVPAGFDPATLRQLLVVLEGERPC